MSDSFVEQAEQEEIFRQKQSDNSAMIFESRGSAGRNPVKLARILTAYDLMINIFGWQNKPLANLTNFITGYQASIDTRYHKDFKDIQVAEEIERKRSNRKDVSLLTK